MLLRKGDKVSLIGTVRFNQDDEKDELINVTVESGDSLWIKKDEAKLVQPLLMEGDAVEDSDGEIGVVIAIYEQRAWIKVDGDCIGYYTKFLKDLKRK